MLEDLVRACSALSDPKVRRVLWQGIGLALLTFAALILGIEAALRSFAVSGLMWLDIGTQILGAAGALVLAWFLFPAVVVATSSLFLEGVVERIEARWYPDLPRPVPVSWTDALSSGLRLLLLSLALNLVALPLYFVPGVNLPIWLMLNGYLIGREYIELVGKRRLSGSSFRAFRDARAVRIWLSGIPIAFLLTIPLVNLVAPIIGAAFMTHRFQRLVPTQGPTLAMAEAGRVLER